MFKFALYGVSHHPPYAYSFPFPFTLVHTCDSPNGLGVFSFASPYVEENRPPPKIANKLIISESNVKRRIYERHVFGLSYPSLRKTKDSAGLSLNPETKANSSCKGLGRPIKWVSAPLAQT